MSSARVESADVVAVGRVAAALRDGEVVLLATETVYGLAGLATEPSAVQRIRSLTGTSGAGRPLAWHAASAGVVVETLGLTGSRRRLVERLAPGPITFLVELNNGQLSAVRERLGVAAGTIDDGKQLAVRVPDHARARDVIERSRGVVVAQSVVPANMGSGKTAPIEAARAAGVTAALDDGPTKFGEPSTCIRLTRGGTWTVVSVGAVTAREVERRAKRVVLFVCTGNTCRSPMGEAIARHVLKQQGEGDLTIAQSVGTDAASGWPMSPEAVVALQSMGIEPSDHRSKRVTREVIFRADVIYALTPNHLRSLLAIDPTVAQRAHTLDPSGAGVIDPIGQNQAFYDETAAQIRSLVEGRLSEILG